MPILHLAEPCVYITGITRRIDWRLSAADTVRAVQNQRGVAIAAHPVQKSWRADDEYALRLLDGAEVAYPLMFSSPVQGEELAGCPAAPRDNLLTRTAAWMALAGLLVMLLFP